MARAPSGQAAWSWGSPGPAAPPGPSAAPSCRQRDKPTHARPRGLAADTHDMTAHAHTHTCTRVCMHKLITFPSPQRLFRPRRSLIPLSEHPSSPLASAERQQHRGRQSAGPAPTALPAALPASQPALPPRSRSQLPRQRNRRNPKGIAAGDHEPPLQHNLPVPGAGAGEAPWPGRKQLSSDPLPRGNRPETRVNRKAKKSPGEGDLPVGGRGRLEDRGESEEACLSWRQGGSPS